MLAVSLAAIAAGTVLLVRAGEGGGGTTHGATGKIVKMEPARFVPAVLHVRRGDTVTFVNVGNVDKWVASDPHPVHTDYPGFDARRTILPGRSWSFRFLRPGHWGYHDHLSPWITGTIVVAP